jgi:hypothetical protein
MFVGTKVDFLHQGELRTVFFSQWKGCVVTTVCTFAYFRSHCFLYVFLYFSYLITKVTILIE